MPGRKLGFGQLFLVLADTFSLAAVMDDSSLHNNTVTTV
jgi:hypothetical protein